MSRLDRAALRKIIIEEVAQARSEVAARKPAISRERVREIILEEVASFKRERMLSESADTRTPKYSLVEALLGEADNKGKKVVFEDGGKGMFKVGGHLYHVMDKNPTEITYGPDFGVSTASKILVRPDSIAALFPPHGGIAGGKADIGAATIDFEEGDYFKAQGVRMAVPVSMEDMMKQLASGVALMMVPMKSSETPVYYIVDKGYLARRKSEFEPAEEEEGSER